VADTSGQSITLRDVSFGDGNRTEPFFKLHLRRPGKESRGESVELSLALASLKEVAVDPTVKGERGYRAPVVVTLVDGTQYRGEAGGQLRGENELGKGSLETNKLAKAVFTRAAGDADYAPESGVVRGRMAEKGGNSFDIVSLTSGQGSDATAQIECSVGEVKFSIPIENITGIEHIGEVKREYSTEPKLRLTLASGRTIEITTSSGRHLRAHFKHGIAEVPFELLANATLEKKK